MPALSAVGWQVQAQMHPASTDSLLLSTHTEGDFTIKRYLLEKRDSAQFTLHYALNRSAIDPSFGDNQATLSQLDDLARQLDDTLCVVEGVRIVGYASPDGPSSLNERLSQQRAKQVVAYLQRLKGLPSKVTMQSASEVVAWSALRGAVEESSLAHRNEVVAILKANHTPQATEQALKAHPDAWHLMTHTLLPPLRRTTICLRYRQGRVVEERIPLPKPKPTPPPTPQPTAKTTPPPTAPSTTDPCCDELMVSESIGFIVAMPNEADN